MRIVAELPRPDCKITIFAMGGKYLVKFEKGSLEQTYKLSELDITGGADGVFRILDEDFIASVVERFKSMKTDFHAAYQRSE